MMILHLSLVRRNVNRKVYNDRENVSATANVIGSSVLPRPTARAAMATSCTITSMYNW